MLKYGNNLNATLCQNSPLKTYTHPLPMDPVIPNFRKKLGGGVVGLMDRANGSWIEVLFRLWHLWSINTPGGDSFPFSRTALLFRFPATKNIP